MMKRLLIVVLVLAGCTGAVWAQSDTAANFTNPPDSARPWVYWFWLNGNITKEAITADLEAMKAKGIGGVLIMETDLGEPKGPVRFAGPQWRELFKHVATEANRLGLQVNMNNDAGWCGSGGPWVTPALSMQKVVWSETVVEGPKRFEAALPRPEVVRNYYNDIAVLAMPAPSGKARIEDFKCKSLLTDRTPYTKPEFPSQPAHFAAAPANSIIPRDKVMDISAKMDKDGKLAWDVPAGSWLILRFGHTTTGVVNHPAPQSGLGLECDKLSKAAAEAHFNAFMGKLIADVGPLAGAGKTLVSTHIDSWEIGLQNWTPLMRQEFQARRGYDLLPYLPVFTGRFVDSAEASERFLWDLRQTASDMLAQNYAGHIRELANQHGLRLSIEAYGDGPFDDMAYGEQADEPMTEFDFWEGSRVWSNNAKMASAGHIYGRHIIGAESFTSSADEKWQKHPALIKSFGDGAFCDGINRMVFHRYALQRWLNRAPGMGMGPFGIHYDRTETWWDQSQAWTTYIARCQSVLQQGLYVADVCYLEAEGAPRQFVAPQGAMIGPDIRGGYNFDGCTTDALLTRMNVKDGRLILPDGMNYRALVLPNTETMTLPVLRKVKELIDGGATVFATSNRIVKTPGLTDYPQCDEEVKKLAEDLWEGGKLKVLPVGRPTDDPFPHAAKVNRWLSEHGLPPDFHATKHLGYTHRMIGDTDVYFVANPSPQNVDVVAKFRVTGKKPELWWPDTGHTAAAIAYEDKDGVTSLPLRLEPSGSLFVVFRQSAGGVDPIVSATCDGAAVLPATSRSHASRTVIQEARYGVLDDPKRTRNVKVKLQAIVDAGSTSFEVRQLAEDDDPAAGAVKTLVADYIVGGKTLRLTGRDPETLAFANDVADKNPILDICRGEIWQSGNYVLKAVSGKIREVRVSLPADQEIAGPWEVTFDPKWGGPALPEDATKPAKVIFANLEDWSKRPEAGIKYYSGTAIYRNTFNVPAAELADAQRAIYLELGQVDVMAEVKLNGKDLGILWKPPYRVDATTALRAGENTLELQVVNLWINRMIGDEQLPEDSQRSKDGRIEVWPKWLREGKPSPTGRFTFATWRGWKKNDPLVASGLLGPVTLEAVEKIVP